MVLMLLLPLLMQAGPLVTPGIAPSLNLPQIDRPNAAARRHRAATIDRPATNDLPNRLEACMAQARRDPAAAIITAGEWLKTVKGAPASEPNLCLGTAYAAQEVWEGAEAAFLAAGEATLPDQPLARARLWAMAGNAALAMAHNERALAHLDAAHALATSDDHLAGGIAGTRALALVALNRMTEAETALTEARRATTEDASVWLLSATLSRRMGKLAQAQNQIVTAAHLAPTDLDIGLEAGVIAMLAGNEDAARKSWQSVSSAAPQSEAGKQAARYLAQIAAPAGTATTGTKTTDKVPAGKVPAGKAPAGNAARKDHSQ